VDDARIGRALRLLRQRRGLRQVDLARIAGVSQSTISTIEAGHLDSLSHATGRRLFAAVGASLESTVRWRGGAIDRLLDERHAGIVSAAVEHLQRLGWLVAIEATYSIYGERGSIDVLAGHPLCRTVLVEEIKSELTSIESMGRKTDEKLRLSRRSLCRARFGWDPVNAGRLIVLPATDAARRLVHKHTTILNVAFPARGAEIRAWLKRPEGDLAGIMFVADIARGGTTRDRRGLQRVRVAHPRVARA